MELNQSIQTWGCLVAEKSNTTGSSVVRSTMLSSLPVGCSLTTDDLLVDTSFDRSLLQVYTSLLFAIKPSEMSNVFSRNKFDVDIIKWTAGNILVEP